VFTFKPWLARKDKGQEAALELSHARARCGQVAYDLLVRNAAGKDPGAGSADDESMREFAVQCRRLDGRAEPEGGGAAE
jgi:hypothetical protein